MTVKASSNWSRRCGGGGRGMPYAWCSFCCHPAPSPSTRRPLLMWSSVAAMFATTAGCRYRLPSTRVPRRSRSVRQARAVITVHPSRTGPSITTSEGSPGMKWS